MDLVTCVEDGCSKGAWPSHERCFDHLIEGSLALDKVLRKIGTCDEMLEGDDKCSNVVHPGYVACLTCINRLAEESVDEQHNYLHGWATAIAKRWIKEEPGADPMKAELAEILAKGVLGYDLLLNAVNSKWPNNGIGFDRIKTPAGLLILEALQEGARSGAITLGQYTEVYYVANLVYRFQEDTPLKPFSDYCGRCWECFGDMRVTWYVLCSTCGNKRCPKSTNHRLECTNSNEPGQVGSQWEHVK